ncbi:MAG: paraquat-inducible protein A [Flavobacteriales bacterium]
MLARFRPVVIILLALGLSVSCFLAYHTVQKAHELKADEMELSSINYGLFNPDRWKDALKGVISDEIINFRIEGSNRETLKRQLENALREVLDGLNRTLETNDHGLSGKVRKAVVKAVVPMDAIRSDVPKYADRILNEVDQPHDREKLKQFVLIQLDSLSAQTSGKIDMHLYDDVMQRRGFTNPEDGIKQLQRDRLSLEGDAMRLGWGIFGALVLMVCLLLLGPASTRLELSVLVATAILLLATALAMPMLDIEARISHFDLTVLGGPIAFKDQVLFYESRSILQVIHLLLQEHDAGLVLVAALVFCFSVVFPFTKLLLSFITAVRFRMPSHPVARFFLLKSAKWSMADVLVVAMFMAYLGFNGVVSGQLADLRDFMEGAHIMTTNNTELEFGFYLFTGYVVLGLVLSVLVERGVTRAHPRTVEAAGTK